MAATGTVVTSCAQAGWLAADPPTRARANEVTMAFVGFWLVSDSGCGADGNDDFNDTATESSSFEAADAFPLFSTC